ncbi:MAG: outer rane immunogenic protein [Alphaproteobacteria bacterium]|nr:outer rane immunogenic protein [Alphaproteobacteria bacterium]
MSKKAIALAGLVLLGAIGAAHAADIPGISRPYAAPARAYAAYNWMGPYIGGNLGYQWGDIAPTKPSGGAFGLQAGYNWQHSQLVLGVETDVQWSNAEDAVAPLKFRNTWFGTSRGRVGYAMNNVLAYGTGGFAYGGVELTAGGLSQSQTQFGWTLGVGAEVGLTQNWTAKVEYLYLDLTDHMYFTGTSHGLESSLLRAGVNYKF